MLYLSVVRSEQNGYRMNAPQWTLATTGAVVLGPGAMIMWRFRWYFDWQSGDGPMRRNRAGARSRDRPLCFSFVGDRGLVVALLFCGSRAVSQSARNEER